MEKESTALHLLRRMVTIYNVRERLTTLLDFNGTPVTIEITVKGPDEDDYFMFDRKDYKVSGATNRILDFLHESLDLDIEEWLDDANEVIEDSCYE